MTLTLELPPDVERQLQGIPQLGRRVSEFLEHEARMEEIRRRRHSERARHLVARALDGAAVDEAAGLDPEQSFQELLELHASITARL